ncbi:MAG: hypothetical protein IJV36_04855 [Prevotella sp.]|nr:hypothetical protein [Prevotella sp.]
MMNVIVLLAVLLCCPAMMQAQESVSLLSPGRSWNYVRINTDGTRDNVSLKLVGVSEYDGRPAYTLAYCTPESTKERCLLQEGASPDEICLLRVGEDNIRERLSAFSTQISYGSSSYEWWLDGSSQSVALPGTLRQRDEVEVSGVRRLRSYFFREGSEEPVDIWVSGIGSWRDGILPSCRIADIVGSDSLEFESCADGDGHILFSKADFQTPRQKDVYRPLLEDHKVWYCASFYPSGVVAGGTPQVAWYYQYFTEGDTIVSGRQCHKVFGSNHLHNGETAYLCAMYEQDGKVWCIERGSAESCLLYDFTMGYDEEISVEFTSLGLPFRTAKKIGDSYFTDDAGEWHAHIYQNMNLVEGIGPDSGLLWPMADDNTTGGFREVVLCTVNGDVIWDRTLATGLSRGSVVGIHTPFQSQVETGIYDLQGRKVSNADLQLPRGVYIQNGRKFVIK